MDPRQGHNYYSLLYNIAVFKVIAEERGLNEAAVFARAATAGGQMLPVHWGGDCESTWPGMIQSLRGGLSLGMSGFSFWSHDIAGFIAQGLSRCPRRSYLQTMGAVRPSIVALTPTWVSYVQSPLAGR